MTRSGIKVELFTMYTLVQRNTDLPSKFDYENKKTNFQDVRCAIRSLIDIDQYPILMDTLETLE